MASPTKKLRNIRKRKMRTRGKRRKRMLRNKGTTPPFPIHLPEESKAAEESGAGGD